MKRLIFVFSLLPFVGGKIFAQKAYTYVRQNGTKLEQLGTAAFDVGENSQPRVHFVDGKAVMTIGKTRVAALPMENGGELVVSYTTDVAEADLNKVIKNPTEQKPFATIYSPFQLVVPSGSEVYAPVFDRDNKLLHFAEARGGGWYRPCRDTPRRPWHQLCGVYFLRNGSHLRSEKRPEWVFVEDRHTY